MVNEVLKWIGEQGGLAGIEVKNRDKAGLLYNHIDGSDGFYRGVAEQGSRSIMNVTFRMQSEELEKQFVKAAEQEGFVGLKGHRSVEACALPFITRFLMRVLRRLPISCSISGKLRANV